MERVPAGSVTHYYFFFFFEQLASVSICSSAAWARRPTSKGEANREKKQQKGKQALGACRNSAEAGQGGGKCATAGRRGGQGSGGRDSPPAQGDTQGLSNQGRLRA